MGSTIPSSYAYLRHVGAFPAWGRVLVLAAFGYGLVEFFLSRQVDSGLGMLLILSPVCVGTGLLSSARQGRLDLLLGCGVPRLAVWKTTMIGAASPAFGGALVLAALNAVGRGTSIPVELGKVGCVAVFTLGVCVAAGVIEPRYLAGIAWLGLKIAFVTSRAGGRLLQATRRTYTEEPVSPAARTLVGAVFPEALLGGPQPALLFVVLAMLGIGALYVSMRVFLGAELTGRRAE